MIRIAIPRDMLQAMSISRRKVGRGIMSVARTVTRPRASIMLLCAIIGESSTGDKVDFEGSAISFL
jgi:hypothetical protein